jgi:hypothetical protein
MKLEFSRKISEKHSNGKFYKNVSSGSRVGPCGGQIDRMVLMVIKLLLIVIACDVNNPRSDLTA